MDKFPTLLPSPRNIQFVDGTYNISKPGKIIINAEYPENLLFITNNIQKLLFESANLVYKISINHDENESLNCIRLNLSPGNEIQPQGYALEINSEGIYIDAKDANGLFYGCCTLIQILNYYLSVNHHRADNPELLLPQVVITDWPDFINRGVMLDISRDKVPTMETLFGLVDLLSSMKINQLQLYTEHTFAYHEHPEVWSNASPVTGEEIRLLDNYCRERFIELVPNQNSFGHLAQWLTLPRYKNLAEAPDGFDFPWGHNDGPFSLCPTNPQSIVFISSLYDELLPNFSSKQFNVGCDETFDLGAGCSKDECEKLGTGRVYLDFLIKIYEQVRSRGFKMQFWGDIIVNYPELVSELPKDCIALEWGYEAEHPFNEHGKCFAQANIPFYVCPGTSAWNSIAGRTDNCIQNLANAATNGLKNGAIGYLNTDWGDNGHWQMLPVSYLGFAAGAAFSWCYAQNSNLDIKSALSMHVFHNPTKVMGSIAYDLGNVYQLLDVKSDNSSILFTILQNPIEKWKPLFEGKNAIQLFSETLAEINQIACRLSEINHSKSDIDLIRQEFELSTHFLRHACMRGLYAYGAPELSKKILFEDLISIIDEYRYLWLMRNRPGGLQDSLAHFETALHEYKQ